jgi:ATP-dependent Clp protease ATP-binding subunit ClpB
MEEQALKRETDKASKTRIEEVKKEIAELQSQRDAMRAQWMAEKEIIGELAAGHPPQGRGAAPRGARQAKRRGDLGKAARDRVRQDPRGRAPGAMRARSSPRCSGPAAFLSEEVTDEDIAQVVSRWTGIPVSKMLESEMQKLLHLESDLRARVVGQEEALAACPTPSGARGQGLGDDRRPIGSFMFLGPTGVGKTELAKALAERLFNDERAMIRIDMSEYGERHAVAR